MFFWTELPVFNTLNTIRLIWNYNAEEYSPRVSRRRNGPDFETWNLSPVITLTLLTTNKKSIQWKSWIWCACFVGVPTALKKKNRPGGGLVRNRWVFPRVNHRRPEPGRLPGVRSVRGALCAIFLTLSAGDMKGGTALSTGACLYRRDFVWKGHTCK